MLTPDVITNTHPSGAPDALPPLSPPRGAGLALGGQLDLKMGLSHSTQEVCPWNVRFSQKLKEPAFRSREILAQRDARTLAAELLAMSQEEFTASFRKSPMKRAKLAGLQRNARVVLDGVDAP